MQHKIHQTGKEIKSRLTALEDQSADPGHEGTSQDLVLKRPKRKTLSELIKVCQNKHFLLKLVLLHCFVGHSKNTSRAVNQTFSFARASGRAIKEYKGIPFVPTKAKASIES